MNFASLAKLERHKLVKPDCASYCDKCGKKLLKERFVDHMNIHLNLKPYRCTLCPDAAYANHKNLQAHIRTAHKGIKRKTK